MSGLKYASSVIIGGAVTYLTLTLCRMYGVIPEINNPIGDAVLDFVPVLATPLGAFVGGAVNWARQGALQDREQQHDEEVHRQPGYWDEHTIEDRVGHAA